MTHFRNDIFPILALAGGCLVLGFVGGLAALGALMLIIGGV